jgi:AraC-like DNA-binding protein
MTYQFMYHASFTPRDNHVTPRRSSTSLAACPQAGCPDIGCGTGQDAIWCARAVPRQGRPATIAARQRLVDQAEPALAAGSRPGLTGLSRELGCSPYHLSHVFDRLTGCTISRYRLRVSRALDRIGDGEHDLARLAHDLGFSDHAHTSHQDHPATGHTRHLPAGRC